MYHFSSHFHIKTDNKSLSLYTIIFCLVNTLSVKSVEHYLKLENPLKHKCTLNKRRYLSVLIVPIPLLTLSSLVHIQCFGSKSYWRKIACCEICHNAKPQLVKKSKLRAIYTPLRGKTGSEAEVDYIFTLVCLLHKLNWIQLIALKLSRAAGVQ